MAMKPLDKVLINPLQAQEMEEDCRAIEAGITAAMRGDPNARRVNMQENQERLARIKRQLAEEVARPGDLTAGERDELMRQEHGLREKITHGMLDEETMRKCPSDAPNRHIQWEQANMKDILRWKNIRQQLDPDNPEAQNLEIYRPRGAQGYGYRADAVIPGKMSYGEVPQENWDRAMSPAPAPVTPTPEPRKRVPRTPEQKAAQAAKMKAYWAAIKGGTDYKSEVK